MKQVLFLFFFVGALSANAQFSDDLCAFDHETETSYQLPKQYKQQISQIKANFLKKMYKDTSSALCHGKLYCESFHEFRQRYDTALYVYDFNYDGKKDILFFDRLCPGFENANVCIFLRDGKEYSMMMLGTWLLSMDLKRSEFQIITAKYPCCADFMMQAMVYEGTKADKEIRQLTNQTFGHTRCDEKIQSSDTIISFNTAKTVMVEPDLNEEQLESYSLDGGALMGTLAANTTVTSPNRVVLHGKTWYYVVIDVNNSFGIEKSWDNNYFGKITTVRGWICGE